MLWPSLQAFGVPSAKSRAFGGPVVQKHVIKKKAVFFGAEFNVDYGFAITKLWTFEVERPKWPKDSAMVFNIMGDLVALTNP